MTKMKAYKVYLEDGSDVYRIIVPATSEKEAIAFCSGNGDPIAVKEFDELKIDSRRLSNDLTKCGWKQDEVDLISRLLYVTCLEQW